MKKKFFIKAEDSKIIIEKMVKLVLWVKIAIGIIAKANLFNFKRG